MERQGALFIQHNAQSLFSNIEILGSYCRSFELRDASCHQIGNSSSQTAQHFQ